MEKVNILQFPYTAITDSYAEKNAQQLKINFGDEYRHSNQYHRQNSMNSHREVELTR